MLDERFRTRVAQLAELAGSEDDGLTAEARERIVARVVAEGPSLVRRARRFRLVAMAAGPVLAAAAAAALTVGTRGGSAPRAALHGGAPVAQATRACASRGVPAGAGNGFVPAESGARLDLSPVALAVASPGARVSLREASSCRTAVGLEDGTVAVHARDLGGGELVVEAREGRVTVHGTLFAVTQRAESLEVEVVEGRVSVAHRTGTHFVGAGERVLLSGVGVARGQVDGERTRALRSLVGQPEIIGLDTLEPAVPAGVDAPRRAPASAAAPRGGEPAVTTPEPSAVAVELDSEPEQRPAEPAPRARPGDPEAVDLLSQAEKARRAGDYAQARELYRRAAEGRGATAEAAWVALARMELGLGHAAQAREATKQRQERFGQGTLGPEALWIDVRAYRQTGDLARARQLAEELVRRWPSSPQARAAQQWMSGE